MMFNSARHALSKYCEIKTFGYSSPPSFFLTIEKLKPDKVQRMICTVCYEVTEDVYVCEFCGGKLVAYNNKGNCTSRSFQPYYCTSFEQVDFVVDFERILERNFTKKEQYLLILMGMYPTYEVEEYILHTRGLKNTCRNLNITSDILYGLRKKLEKLLIEADYMEERDEGDKPKRTKRQIESIKKKYAKISQRIQY